jgi:type II secretory pathway component GspD/PulD (secretin)
VILVVTPQINEDGFITMLIEPSVTKTVASEIASDIVDPRSRSARALVRVRQGETLVMGGLIDRTEEETLQQVPILSGIPFLGEAFKNKENSEVASELIIFVTPTILGEPSGSRVASVGQAPSLLHEQERSPSRQDLIEETLNYLERPKL